MRKAGTSGSPPCSFPARPTVTIPVTANGPTARLISFNNKGCHIRRMPETFAALAEPIAAAPGSCPPGPAHQLQGERPPVKNTRSPGNRRAFKTPHSSTCAPAPASGSELRGHREFHVGLSARDARRRSGSATAQRGWTCHIVRCADDRCIRDTPDPHQHPLITPAGMRYTCGRRPVLLVSEH
jgi:hypothetical protein